MGQLGARTGLSPTAIKTAMDHARMTPPERRDLVGPFLGRGIVERRAHTSVDHKTTHPMTLLKYRSLPIELTDNQCPDVHNQHR
jgi:hypothetical protein